MTDVAAHARALILSYHRIADEVIDPWGLCVTRAHFRDHLDALRARANVMPLAELTDGIQRGAVPPRGVAITFDDGYADNLYSAKPLLAEAGVPATVFIVSGSMESQREFWWDTLQNLVLGPHALPATLTLTMDGSAWHWDLGDAASWDDSTWLQHRTWRASRPAPSLRHALYLDLWRLLRPLADSPKSDLLNRLAEWADSLGGATGATIGRSPARAVSLSELKNLAAGELIEIGAHTVSHPLLTTLSTSEQEHEIAASKGCLEQVLEGAVSSFAYPYGDCDAFTKAVVRASGFDSACSTRAGAIDSASDCFLLPRVQVPDCTGDALARRLSEWFA